MAKARKEKMLKADALRSKKVPENDLDKAAREKQEYFLARAQQMLDEQHDDVKEMNKYVESKEKKVKKMYFFYTTCPNCAKHYGKNYVVAIAEI